MQLAIASYWFLREINEKKHLKAREFISRKPITHKKANNSIRSIKRNLYTAYKESKEILQLNQAAQEKPAA